jgi:hypothetical protein
MQINNNTSASLFSEFQRIREEQRANCERRIKYAAHGLAPTPSRDYGGVVTAFQDANIRIQIADRDYRGVNQDERFSRIYITCMRTFQGIGIIDRELADELYNKFLQMADNKELDCNIEEFTDTRKNQLKMLIFDWLFAMLYGSSDEQSTNQSQAVTAKQTVTEAVADEIVSDELKDLIAEFLEKNGLQTTCRELIESIVDMVQKTMYKVKPNIHMLSEEELSQVEPTLTETINGTTAKAYASNLWANLGDD